MNNEQFITMTILVLLIIPTIYFLGKYKQKGILENTNKALFSLKDIELYTKFSPMISDVIKSFYLSVTVQDCLSILKKESGYLGLTKENSQIIGDNNLKNKAFGVMQVRKPAMLDVNTNFSTVYKENDLKQLHVNIIIGCCYLDLCKQQAKKETVSKTEQKKLMFKKYNAGIGTKLDNSKGEEYSILVLENLNIFSNIG